jgi:hypothetical protein
MLSAERLERIFGCPCGWRGRPGQCAAFRPGDRDCLAATGVLGVMLSARLALADVIIEACVAAGTACLRVRAC